MVEKARNIGVKVTLPSKTCKDKKCPFHGDLSVRGKGFTGIIIKRDVHKTATVEWSRRIKIPKYERYEKKRTKVQAHNPGCIDAKEGDTVKIMECRPLSKTKNFVIIENLGKHFGFEQMEESREEAKQVSKKKDEKPVEPKIEEDSELKEKVEEEKTDESN
jgi:small subunit ribosomal protein S17